MPAKSNGHVPGRSAGSKYVRIKLYRKKSVIKIYFSEKVASQKLLLVRLVKREKKKGNF